jgi:hypothetical protein
MEARVEAVPGELVVPGEPGELVVRGPQVAPAAGHGQ